MIGKRRTRGWGSPMPTSTRCWRTWYERLLPHIREQPLGIQMTTPHREQLAGLILGRHLVEPIPMVEAQKGLHGAPDRALEPLDRLHVLGIKTVERHDKEIGEHQERSFVKVRDETKNEVLTPKLSQQACRSTRADGSEAVPALRTGRRSAV